VKQEAALKFLEKAHGSFADALELKDVVPLLEAMEMYEGIVQLCVAKADAIVRSSLRLTIMSGVASLVYRMR
jgi:hypothetical protein